MSALSLTLTFDGHRVRMAGTPERPEWIAKDACFVLGLTTHNAGQGIPDGEKGHCAVVTPGGPQDMVTVTEAGLYRLIARSRKPSARRFQSWLFGEVLPSIRRHGCYPPPATPAVDALAGLDLRDFNQLARVALQLTGIVKEQADRLAITEPKAATFDACMSSDDLLTVGKVAQMLSRPGRPMGELRLFQFLRAAGVLQHGNRPYQRFVDAGYFRVREVPITAGASGSTRIHVQPLVTQAGVDYIRRRLDGEDGQGSLLPARAPSGGPLSLPPVSN